MKNGIRKLISAVLCLTLLFYAFVCGFCKGQSSCTKNFKDVKPGHWAYEAIMWMLDRNIIDGVGGNRFDPNGTVTRAQFAKMMVNTLDLKEYAPQNAFIPGCEEEFVGVPVCGKCQAIPHRIQNLHRRLFQAVTAGSEGGYGCCTCECHGVSE